jgi:hypothetical protein
MRHISSHISAKARILHISVRKRMPALTKKEMRPDDLRELGLGHLAARPSPRRARRWRIGQREGKLLHGRRAGFLQVVAEQTFIGFHFGTLAIREA